MVPYAEPDRNGNSTRLKSIQICLGDCITVDVYGFPYIMEGLIDESSRPFV